MNTPLAPGELIWFSFSSFDCQAKRLGSELDTRRPTEHDEVWVDVQMCRGNHRRITLDSTLTRAEIKELTAYKIADKLGEMEKVVRGYANTVRREAIANAE